MLTNNEKYKIVKDLVLNRLKNLKGFEGRHFMSHVIKNGVEYEYFGKIPAEDILKEMSDCDIYKEIKIDIDQKHSDKIKIIITGRENKIPIKQKIPLIKIIESRIIKEILSELNYTKRFHRDEDFVGYIVHSENFNYDKLVELMKKYSIHGRIPNIEEITLQFSIPSSFVYSIGKNNKFYRVSYESLRV